MHLYLVQHAEAMSKEEDPTRSLSPKGIEDIKKVSEFLAKFRIQVHQILHSGKMRALQTAQELSENIISDMGIIEADGLLPMDDPSVWLDRISKKDDDLMLAGHMPYMGKLASLLLCGREKNAVDFETGCVVCLKRSENGVWSVDWIIKPWMTG